MNAKHALAALAAIICTTAEAVSLPEPVDADELAGVRGGFVSAGGFTFSFAATLTTLVDGELALQSTMRLDGDGVRTTASQGGIAGSLPLQAAPEFNELAGEGIVLPGIAGSTAVIQAVSIDAIRNIVVNTASDRTISQMTAITITIPELPELQQAVVDSRLYSALGDALDTALVNSIPH
jgi:hypothetical protein